MLELSTKSERKSYSLQYTEFVLHILLIVLCLVLLPQRKVLNYVGESQEN